MKDIIDFLPSEYSWWLLNEDNELHRLNETEPTVENVRILFKCESCDDSELNLHVLKVSELKVHSDGDYDACCPYNEELEEYEAFIQEDEVPTILMDIFHSVTFKKNYEEE
ncbi:MAG: hypothetical protein ACLU84_07050 [Clostridia bacterium]